MRSERWGGVGVLAKPVESLEGVGSARAQQLRGIGVATLGDLLEYFPRDYQFETSELALGALREGQICTARGEVSAVDYVVGRGKPRFEATLSEGMDRLALVFFNGSYLRRKIHPGLMLRVQGEVRSFRGIAQMVNPKWQAVDESTEKIEETKFRPIYPATGKLPSEAIEKIVAANLSRGIEAVGEWFETGVLAKRKMIGRAEAYRAIHQPKDLRQAIVARRRLVYDELMVMQLGLALSHRLTHGRFSAPVLRVDRLLDQRIRKRFPFELTAGQQSAVWQIVKDMQSGKPMKRLLQGDVGSGKTVVALYAMLVAVANKMQAAILAPTEVLAEQHFLTMSNALKDSSVTVELFTSRTRRQSKGALLAGIAQGKVHLAVGTQSLLQEDIEFANLGLVVVDEQHRLGVMQRASLSGKGVKPHYLVMTATPIPRTLALSYFADFDVTTIDELPPGRQPISTRWMRQSQAAKAHEFILNEVKAGRQAYIVLPQINDDGMDDAKSVLREFEHLAKGPFKGIRVGMLHGQLSTEEKQQTMAAFRDGAIDVLVSTTVIEVGIDVANATVILIDSADRFGLSQLHQLRGRVGRGKHASHCILLSDAPTPGAEARMKAMTETSSGFEIAELDLQLRGPGEFFGTRQHGLPEFKLADVRQEMELLGQAKEDAHAILDDDPRLTKPAHAGLRAKLAEQFGETLELAQVG